MNVELIKTIFFLNIYSEISLCTTSTDRVIDTDEIVDQMMELRGDNLGKSHEIMKESTHGQN